MEAVDYVASTDGHLQISNLTFNFKNILKTLSNCIIIYRSNSIFKNRRLDHNIFCRYGIKKEKKHVSKQTSTLPKPFQPPLTEIFSAF